MDKKRQIEVLKKEIEILREENNSLNKTIEGLQVELELERFIPQEEQKNLEKLLQDTEDLKLQFEQRIQELDKVKEEYNRLIEILNQQMINSKNEFDFLVNDITNTKKKIKKKRMFIRKWW